MELPDDDELRALQDERLVDTVERAYQNVPYYRERLDGHGVAPDDIDGVGAYCVDDPCHGLDYLGRCNGSVAEWCDDGELRTEDCAAWGTTCAYINDEIGYYCR
mgnify:CR=1 FL=1